MGQPDDRVVCGEARPSYRMSFVDIHLHPTHVPEPTQASLGEDGEHARHACLGQNAFVCDPVLPGGVQESSEVTHVKGIQSLLLVRVQRPGIAAVEKSAQHGTLNMQASHTLIVVLSVRTVLSHTPTPSLLDGLWR